LRSNLETNDGEHRYHQSEIQIIAELEALRALKVPFVFVVDDNLIGNKKEMKKILHHVIAWQQAKGYPLTFVTEASLDLADDDELMQLMVEANFNGLFVGIESTNEDALRETKKTQNMRRSGTLIDKVRRIQDAGLEVWAGMIVGFDNDNGDVFDSQRRFIENSRISLVMVGMLSAIPKTPLYPACQTGASRSFGSPKLRHQCRAVADKPGSAESGVYPTNDRSL
jgi:radical SAM superfamily enzyme YgiQ (UPF0313 family)